MEAGRCCEEGAGSGSDLLEHRGILEQRGERGAHHGGHVDARAGVDVTARQCTGVPVLRHKGRLEEVG